MTDVHLPLWGRPRTPDHAARPNAREGARTGGLELWLVLIACLAAESIVGALLLRQGGFWSPDSAVRVVQVESLLRARYHDLAVPYPAASLDPAGRYFPAGGWFRFERGGRFYLAYLPYFAMAAAPFYRRLGPAGLLLIPAAAGLAAVWITYGVLRRRAPGMAWAGALALGVGTPLVIYGAQFWDHAPAVALSAGALALAVGEIDRDPAARPGRLALAGVLLGLGFWIRTEAYLLAIAAALGWMSASAPPRTKGIAALVAGLALPAGVLWALNTALYGSPFGWKGHDLVTTRVGSAVQAVSGHTPAAWAVEKLGNAYYLLASPDFFAFSPRAVALGCGLAAALVVSGLLLRIGVARRLASVTAAGGLCAIGVSGLIVSGRTLLSGLLPAAPLVVLALLPGGAARWERFLWVTSALFTAAVIATGTHGGLQWGPRYLLPILPALVWLAAAAVARARDAAPQVWPVLRRGALGIAMVSLLIQASGVDQVRQATAQNARINQWLRGIPARIVITPLEWLTLGVGPLYFDKDLMLVRSPEDFKALVVHLSEQRVGHWAYIPYSGPIFAPHLVERWTDGRSWRFHADDDRTWNGIRFVTFAGAAATQGAHPPSWGSTPGVAPFGGSTPEWGRLHTEAAAGSP